MKILFTGCTSKQTSDDAWKRARVKRIDDSSIICKSLRKQGYNVTRKPITMGEDISEYDLAIVGIGQFGSMNYSGQIFNAIYTIGAAKKVIIFFEDWKIDGVMKSIKSTIEPENFQKTITKRYSTGEIFYGGADSELFDKDKILETMNKILNGDYPALIPAFDWGDKSIVSDIIKTKEIYNLDLTPYVLDNWSININHKNNLVKERKHMLASLVDHTAWVKRNKLSWEVDYFGAKSLKDAIQLETETDVFNTCAKYWSILCPEYPHAGSGWFRIRWIYAAINKSVLVSSIKDINALGLEYKNVEQLSDDELEKYANDISEKVLSYSWNVEKFDKKISELMDKFEIIPDENNIIDNEWE